MRACENPDCSTSSAMDESLTFGRGALDDYGYWEIPCAICARAFEKEHPEYGPCWPYTKRRNQMDLNPVEIANIIGVPVMDWPGSCYGIACMILQHHIVDGHPAYGHWTGPVSEHAPVFGDRTHHPFQRHGWILNYDQDDEPTIIDPTRWVFEAVLPYIYHGPNDYYDEGGECIREALRGSCPKYDRHKTNHLPIEGTARLHVEALIHPHKGFTMEQIFWLSNLPYDMHGKHVHEVYQAICDSGHQAAIPFDLRTRCKREYGPLNEKEY